MHEPHALRALVVFAHPSEASFSRALLDAAVEGFGAAGHEVTVHNLYADDFDPRLDAAEFASYDTDDPVGTPRVQQWVDDLARADVLVFVYPTWWWGLPAILKGWFDRVLRPGHAFTLGQRFGPPRPGLTNIKRIIGVTTYGSPRWASRVLPDGGRRIIRRTLRLLCSRRLRTNWLALYGVDGATPHRRQAFLDEVRSTMAAVR